jgi:hypothetical protein
MWREQVQRGPKNAAAISYKFINGIDRLFIVQAHHNLPACVLAHLTLLPTDS